MSIKAELCIDYGNAGPLLCMYVCNMNTSKYVTKYMMLCITVASISNRESLKCKKASILEYTSNYSLLID